MRAPLNRGPLKIPMTNCIVALRPPAHCPPPRRPRLHRATKMDNSDKLQNDDGNDDNANSNIDHDKQR